MVARLARASMIALAFALVSSSASAAPTAKDRAEARTLWTKGKRYAAKQELDDAITALRAACELDPKAQYQLDLARALESDGLLIEAREVAQLVVTTTEANTQRAKQAASKLVESLDERIPTLRVTVSGSDAASARVRVGSEEVETGKDLPFDPGRYVVRAETPAGARAEERIELKERAHPVVRLELVGGAVAKPAEDDDGKGTMVPAIVAYSLGGVGVVVGSIFGVRAFQTQAEVEAICGGTTCPPKELGNIELTLEYGNISTVAFAAGGLAVAAGLVLTFTVGRDSAPESAATGAATLVPVVTPGFVGFAGRF